MAADTWMRAISLSSLTQREKLERELFVMRKEDAEAEDLDGPSTSLTFDPFNPMPPSLQMKLNA
jgi:hypothetical protein